MFYMECLYETCLTLKQSAKMMLYGSFFMIFQIKSLSPTSESSQVGLYSSETASNGDFFFFPVRLTRLLSSPYADSIAHA